MAPAASDHVPASAVSVSPTAAVPPTVGRAPLAGRHGTTWPVGSEVALAAPDAFVTVSATRSVMHSSAATST